METIKERVLKIAEYYTIPKDTFIKEIGMTYANFKGKAKYTPLNSNAIANILSKYPDINSEWLLTGKGFMLKKDEYKDISDDDCDKLRSLITEKDIRISQLKGEVDILGYTFDLSRKLIENIEKENKELKATLKKLQAVNKDQPKEQSGHT